MGFLNPFWDLTLTFSHHVKRLGPLKKKSLINKKIIEVLTTITKLLKDEREIPRNLIENLNYFFLTNSSPLILKFIKNKKKKILGSLSLVFDKRKFLIPIFLINGFHGNAKFKYEFNKNSSFFDELKLNK
ncbi:hypothetical protein BpHYR1_032508 [Brachionus plicatilis]|uniref:Uncharacterized protein n=1 Tax=Brachionus plicatilis TaxID=10195 RepID=A0A3M7Q493_BRAPC|nr:hypothetical protein BpHYR1_032508 [Brachionus plicatilis]